ncbi:dynamin-like protein, putative [Eimeria brunetti]|uniref:Dynamin-like protein, putative n=1 Tax=Eimeria brunetti TaxID=51314 RepID=U6LGL6_9EIME|nr:dynamin-like protein, putative [Eimeria brunetti]
MHHYTVIIGGAAAIGISDQLGHTIPLGFLRIAVVGAQSVGKSSVLEAVIGKDFLPRGTGIVTRRPLILQLQHTSGTTEWGEFSHSPGHRFTDFAQIRREIERETERVTGRSKNISPIPICLKIFSPNVIDLTLVDLPGITKVPVGDQPSDIELQIRKIVLQYISQPSCVILAITAANTDIANSDSLKIARDADPEGIRTIGVVTKVDTMEEGCDCADVLLGKVYPLRRGYVHGTYSPRRTVLMQHIRESLPELRERLQKRLQEAEAELAGYGDPLLEAKGNAGALLLHFFSKFARNFQDAIDGKLQSQHSSDHLMGGARINFIFHDWYGRALAEFDPLSGLTDHEIRTAIRNATGPKAALFVPESAFEILVKKQIQQLETPSLLCVEQVYDELQKIVEKSELPEMSRFTNLRDRILEVVCAPGLGSLLQPPLPQQQQNVKPPAQWEKELPPSPRGEFGSGGIRMPAVPPVVAPSDIPSDREQIETELIKSLLWSYFQIVRKNVADAVPKAIMYFMVNTAKDVLQRELVAQLYREELFGELMKEAGDISAKRQQCKQLLNPAMCTSPQIYTECA